MITRLSAKRFKSWADLSGLQMAPLTAFFGTNSSGKTSLLQLLLLLKQTVESADRARVLHTGDAHTYIDLGTFYDLVYEHAQPGKIEIGLEWELSSPLKIDDPETSRKTRFEIKELAYAVSIAGSSQEGIGVEEFSYRFQSGAQPYRFGMQRQRRDNQRKEEYSLVGNLKRVTGRAWPLPRPVKSYGFPDQVTAYFQNASFLPRISFAFEELFQHTYYLGPLREYPRRTYVWAGDEPQDVGQRGESAIAALLATRNREKISRGYRKKRQSVEERVAECLRDLGLIHRFELIPVAENRKDYEVWVQTTAQTAKVRITDVGFGVSQLLPVLVLCYYVPEGSTLILEQPEIHLHPAVQAGLADVFIDAIKTRKIQIIVESHSEHLLRRLQRRIAEGTFKSDQTALYFTRMDGKASRLERLEVDLFGNILNWPQNFFGDEMGDLVAMTQAAVRRRSGGDGATPLTIEPTTSE
jgi:predicted ATPase